MPLSILCLAPGSSLPVQACISLISSAWRCQTALKLPCPKPSSLPHPFSLLHPHLRIPLQLGSLRGWHPHPCRGPKGHLNTSLARHCPHAVPPQALTILPLPSGGPPHLSILAAVALALTATVPCLPSSRVLLVPHNLLWPFQSVMVNFTCHLDWTMVCLD